MVMGVVGLLGALFIFLVIGFTTLSATHIVLAIVGGMLYITSIFLYFHAVQMEEASRVVALFYLTPLFAGILAAVFLGEILTPTKYGGAVLLIIGAILITSKNPFQPLFGKVLWVMATASFLHGTNWVIVKHLLNVADFWTIFSYMMIGGFFGVLPFFYYGLRHALSTTREHGKKVIIINNFCKVLVIKW